MSTSPRSARLGIDRRRLGAWARLMRWHRPIGAALLLWPTLWALWAAAGGHPPAATVLIFVAGVWLMRSAGCVLNDLADRHFDPHVARTRERPLATGEVTPREALALAVVLLAVAAQLLLFLRPLTCALAGVAVVLAAGYPLLKRYTYLPQLGLGMAFSWGIPMAYAELTGGVPAVAWLLLIANLLWTVVYDTMYAMVDREDDLRIGVRSTAILFGDNDRLALGVLQVLMVLALVAFGRRAGLDGPYLLGVLAATALAVYHQWLIRDRDPAACLRAFAHNQWIGAAVFAGLVADYGLR